MDAFAIISTDWHIKLDNSEQSKDLAAQKIQLAKEKGVDILICLGDVFESRKAQPEDVLHTFREILDMIQEAGMILYCIPGNHDKTNYLSTRSYLDVFEHHPALKLFSRPIFEMGFLFVPFFDTEIWVSYVEEYIKLAKEAKFWKDNHFTLLSHQAVDGSMNNDRSKVESKINGGLLKQFKSVFLGHYHNAQQPYKNTFHLPSWKQDNFGEDSQKGFTILYKDGETEFVKSKFKEYEILELDAGKVDSEIVQKLIEEYKVSDICLRVDFVGDEEEINSIDLGKLKTSGIKVKSIPNRLKSSIELAESGEVVDWESSDKILEAFKEFCKERELDNEKGLIYLTELIKQNGTV